MLSVDVPVCEGDAVAESDTVDVWDMDGLCVWLKVESWLGDTDWLAVPDPLLVADPLAVRVSDAVPL